VERVQAQRVEVAHNGGKALTALGQGGGHPREPGSSGRNAWHVPWTIVRSADTSREAYDRQIDLYRAMSPARRVEIAVAMSEESLVIAAEGIKARHREYDEDQIRWALRRLRLGDALFRQVWPNAPVLAL
jgi:hypothetical protein